MNAKEFWNTQVPTDANKTYVSDFFATKFDRDDLFRFAEAFCKAEIERRITEEMFKAWMAGEENGRMKLSFYGKLDKNGSREDFNRWRQ